MRGNHGGMTRRKNIIQGACNFMPMKVKMEYRPANVQDELVCPFCGAKITYTLLNTLRNHGRRCDNCHALIFEKIAYKVKDAYLGYIKSMQEKDIDRRDAQLKAQIKKDIGSMV